LGQWAEVVGMPPMISICAGLTLVLALIVIGLVPRLWRLR